MECIRQLLLRCGEALFLLQLLSQHLLARLIQNFDANTRQAIVQLTFHQLVCSEDGDRLATRLISALMEVIKTLLYSPSHHILCSTNLRSRLLIMTRDLLDLNSPVYLSVCLSLSFSLLFLLGGLF